MLLATGKVDADSKDQNSRTPLSWAAEEGHETVVKLLLATGEVDVHSKDLMRRTPLWWAAEKRRKAVVKLLLATGEVDVDLKFPTPPSLAADEAVVKLPKSHRAQYS